jgi:hypothetical protein
LAVWTNSAGVQEGALFNIDQPLEYGMPLGQLMATPAGCISDRVGDPALTPILTEGFPPGPCVAAP